MNKFSLAQRNILKNIFLVSRYNNVEVYDNTKKFNKNFYSSRRNIAFSVLILHAKNSSHKTKIRGICFSSGRKNAYLKFFGLNRLEIKKKIYNLNVALIFVAA